MYRQLLIPEELARVDSRRGANGQHEALITRAFIRCVLSQYSELQPQDWLFDKGFNGKPFVTNSPTPLSFNLSHAKNLIVCAVTKQLDVGIDVEYIKRKSDTYKLAPRYFSDSEVQALQALPYAQQPIDFYHYWTLKESYIKACGDGLAIPLDHFSFVITEDDAVTIEFSPQRDDNPNHWQHFLYHPTDEHKMALSVRVESTKELTINMRSYVPLHQPEPVTLPL